MTMRRFHFQSSAQWKTCLFVQADGNALRAERGMQPFAAFVRKPVRLESDGAFAPAVTPAGELLWRDRHGCLLRLSRCDDSPVRSSAPAAIGHASRVIANRSGLWALAPDGTSLQRFDDETLSRVLVVDLGELRAIDIADRGRGKVLVLGVQDDILRVLTVEPAGRIVSAVELPGLSNATAFTYLRSPKRLVVLGGERQQALHWFAQGTLLFSRVVAALHPCFEASVLGSDARERLFVAGRDGRAFGGAEWVLLVDADGNFLGDVPIEPLDAPVTGVTSAPGALVVAGARGLLRFDASEVVPEGAGELRAMVLTPMLHAPDREDRRRWLRIEATADLPEGSTLEIAFAATSDQAVKERLLRAAADRTATDVERVATILNEPDLWRAPTVFTGRPSRGPATADPFSAPLFDVRDPYVWVLITLRAAPGAGLPRLSTLDVLYPGRTLMESLPAIYQREEERPDSFLRPLVGVLEATTQGLDARIKGMSAHLSPSTAAPEWLDFVARWLGVPWDDAMSHEQKRRILANAPTLAQNRGTRAGLEALLEGLLPTTPGGPPAYRVTDATADFGFARIGGEGCPGSRLPAMLGGRTPWSTELGRDAVLGRMRLPCPGESHDGVQHLAGRITVDIAATADGRGAMAPWLEAVLRDMVPLIVKLTVRWVPPQALHTYRLDGTMTLGGAPEPLLGTGAITGLARLPPRGGRLSTTGPTLSTRLR